MYENEITNIFDRYLHSFSALGFNLMMNSGTCIYPKYSSFGLYIILQFLPKNKGVTICRKFLKLSIGCVNEQCVNPAVNIKNDWSIL